MISHLTIKGASYLGLFGELRYEAKIGNLGLLDVEVTGSGYCTGSLAGMNRSGVVVACYSTGAVTGASDTGGLVGANGGTILGSYAASRVAGSRHVGGLAGTSGVCLGDRIPCSPGRISDSYATGTVTGVEYVAGVVGYNTGTLTRCYSVGVVTGDTTRVDGLAGPDASCSSGTCDRALVDACFWDVQTSGQAISSGGGIGKTTAEMHSRDTFVAAGWDFVGRFDGPDDIWAEPDGGGYPILWWQLSPLPSVPPFSGGTGEPNDPYRISTPEDLSRIGRNPQLMGSHFELADDLDLAGCCFRPIGDIDYPYTGVFDGGGHTISGLSVTGETCAGLFERVVGANAEIRNVRLVDPNVNGGTYAGALVGWLEKGVVVDCTVTDGHVAAEGTAGGLVGYFGNGSITGCSITGTYIVGNGAGGGLAGYQSNGNTSHCSVSTGNVSGRVIAGGLVGNGPWQGGAIVRCFVQDVQVQGYDLARQLEFVGGLVALAGDCTISECHVVGGTVRGAGEVGGLVGWNQGTIAGCFAATCVQARGAEDRSGPCLVAGGLVGLNSEAIENCRASSTVSQGQILHDPNVPFLEGVGGLAGCNRGRIDWSYSTGAITGTEYVGGLVGDNTRGTVNSCLWDTQASGQTTSAGGTGKSTAEMQAASTFREAGWDFVDETTNGTEDIWWIDEGKDYPRLWWEAAAEPSP